MVQVQGGVPHLSDTKGCSRNYPQGRAQTLFCPVGGGCFVDNVSEGWGGGGVTCPGGQGIFDP